MIRVLLADDSAVMRNILQKIIEAQDDMRICAAVADGAQALEAYVTHRPDIVIMDVEMPVMDGMGALQRILENHPRARVIMCSALTQAGSEVTMNALRIGAVDYILKPAGGEVAASAAGFSADLVAKIRASMRPSGRIKTPSMPHEAKENPATGHMVLRPAPLAFYKADILAIGSSTGGVQAIFSVLEGLGARKPDIPVVITQHMPPAFTRILAAHIAEKTGLASHEAEDGMIVEKNHIYIARGGYHMEIVRAEGALRLHLSDAPPENFCRPAVDPMLRSLLTAGIPHILAVILTGMGNDGLAGARALVERGHMLLAQDEMTSVVWGMPGAVALAGLCHAVLPLPEIGPYIARYL